LIRWNASNGGELQADADTVAGEPPAAIAVSGTIGLLNRGSQYHGCRIEPW
jgi:hypothetical protein